MAQLMSHIEIILSALIKSHLRMTRDSLHFIRSLAELEKILNYYEKVFALCGLKIDSKLKKKDRVCLCWSCNLIYC